MSALLVVQLASFSRHAFILLECTPCASMHLLPYVASTGFQSPRGQG